MSRGPLLTRRKIAVGALAAPALFVGGRAATHIWSSYRRDAVNPAPPAIFRDALMSDQGRFDWVRVDKVVRASADDVLVVRAVSEVSNGCVTIGGSRHSMGGQTLREGSVHIETTPASQAKGAPDGSGGRITYSDGRYATPAGATWRDILDVLARDGASVAVMQSNNDFSVGGSISVNAHGWQTLRGPVGETVKSLDVVLAAGEKVHCSRSENEALFRGIVGGYGLLGVIVSAEMEAAGDAVLECRSTGCAVEDYVAKWRQHVEGNRLCRLSYGRLRVSQKRFLEEAELHWFDEVVGRRPPIVTSTEQEHGLAEKVARAVFRGSSESEYGKRLRWDLERLSGGESPGDHTRNGVMNRSARFFTNRDPDKVDILCETFVPQAMFIDYVKEVRRILPRHAVDLLNITVRDVSRDDTALLAYARENVFALVFLFNIAATAEADARLGACVRSLVDAALDLRGSYYLPYRRYATRAQFERAYPSADAFRALREQFDSARKFRSLFSDTYLL